MASAGSWLLLWLMLLPFSPARSGHDADSFPSRPITIVVPYPAGGPTDTIARLLAQRMQKPLGQPVVVINISGGGGSIGVGQSHHSQPDGYVLTSTPDGGVQSGDPETRL